MSNDGMKCACFNRVKPAQKIEKHVTAFIFLKKGISNLGFIFGIIWFGATKGDQCCRRV